MGKYKDKSGKPLLQNLINQGKALDLIILTGFYTTNLPQNTSRALTNAIDTEYLDYLENFLEKYHLLKYEDIKGNSILSCLYKNRNLFLDKYHRNLPLSSLMNPMTKKSFLKMTKILKPNARIALYKAIKKDKFSKSIEYLGFPYSAIGPGNQWMIPSMREINKKHNGKFFFRKHYPSKQEYLHQINTQSYVDKNFFFGWDIMKKRYKTEQLIAKRLKSHPNKNIGQIYAVTKNYLDMELLNPLTVNNKKKFHQTMKKIKQYLHNLDIMYIDWKLNNIGVDKNGIYKLYDFDGSGIVEKKDKTKWLVKPPLVWQYITSEKHGCKTPIEIDNCSFDMNILGRKTCNCK